MESEEKQLSIIKEVFTPDKFEIEQRGTLFIIYTLNKEQCVNIRIANETIGINSLDKCGVRGEETLQKIEELAIKMPNVTRIVLFDGSRINKCGTDLDLAKLKILTKGESWYNSKGYVTSEYNEEKDNNKKIIESEFKNFIDELNPSIKERCAHLFPDIDMKLSVKKYFNNILERINRDDCSTTNSDRIKLLDEILTLIGDNKILQYTPGMLRKRINKGGRKSRRKSKKSRNRGKSQRWYKR